MLIPEIEVLPNVRFFEHGQIPQENLRIFGRDERFKAVKMIIVKVTSRCNLGCKYCYEDTDRNIDMSLRTYMALVDKVLESSINNHISFVFHWGEPTLVSDNWYENAMRYTRQKAETYRKQVHFSIQTNFRNIPVEKIMVYKKLGMNIGVSIDGPSYLDLHLRSNSEETIKNLELAKCFEIKTGILMTINQENFNHFSQICEWLEESLEISRFKLNTIYPVGKASNLPGLEPNKIFLAYKDVLEYMIKTKAKKVIEENISLEVMRFFSSSNDCERFREGVCNKSKCGFGETVLGITPDGYIVPCGRFQTGNQSFYCGHVTDSQNEESLNVFTKKINSLHQTLSSSRNECDHCAAKNICGYGCQAFMIQSRDHRNVDCVPTKMRFSYYLANKERLSSIIDTLKNLFTQNSSEFHLSSSSAKNTAVNHENYFLDYRDYYNDYSDKAYSDYYDRS